ncbi:MAG TPA: hypothetical protein VL460_02895 [Caulobacteraceae bacterium]|nr:hypothetical protein [Caulobacteraceae bacterium]
MDRRTFGIGATGALLSGAKAVAAAPAARLDGPRRPPARAPARYLIVLLHGFGSNGDDMIGLVPEFQPYAPTAAFAAPNATHAMGGGSYSWFTPQPQGQANRDTEQARAARAAAGGGPALDAFIDAELARYNLAPERLILLGFSQGASTVLNSGLRLKTQPAAIIAFSGNNLSPAGLARTGRRTPVLLIQGDQDDRVTAAGQRQSMAVLKDIGSPATAHILPGLGHDIDDRGIKLAGELIRSVTQG